MRSLSGNLVLNQKIVCVEKIGSVFFVLELQFRRQAGTDRRPFQSRPKVPMQKLSPSKSVKSQIHAPAFYEFAQQILFYARCRAIELNFNFFR